MTVNFLEFRDRFPEFYSVSDRNVERAMETARNIHSASDEAQLHLIAHLLELSRSDDSAAGEVISESVGPKSVTYMSQAGEPNEAYFTRTSYGQTFLVLEKRATPFSARVYG